MTCFCCNMTRNNVVSIINDSNHLSVFLNQIICRSKRSSNTSSRVQGKSAIIIVYNTGNLSVVSPIDHNTNFWSTSAHVHFKKFLTILMTVLCLLKYNWRLNKSNYFSPLEINHFFVYKNYHLNRGLKKLVTGHYNFNLKCSCKVCCNESSLSLCNKVTHVSKYVYVVLLDKMKPTLFQNATKYVCWVISRTVPSTIGKLMFTFLDS